MLELGAESERGHREVGEAAATLGVDHLISIGNDTIALAAEQAGLENSAIAQDASDAAEMLNEIVGPGDLVLIKGSRSSRTELVLDEFVQTPPVGGNIPMMFLSHRLSDQVGGLNVFFLCHLSRRCSGRDGVRALPGFWEFHHSQTDLAQNRPAHPQRRGSPPSG
jgi:hypothetical protein